jgi:hypothetical protein
MNAPEAVDDLRVRSHSPRCQQAIVHDILKDTA